MIARLSAIALLVSVANLAAVPEAHAFAVNVDDGCGVAIGGGLNAMNVDANGNVSMPGFSTSTWVAGIGVCDAALPYGSPPQCSLHASQTRIETNSTITLHARCRTPVGQPLTAFTWYKPTRGAAFPGDAGGRAHMGVTFTEKGSYAITMQAGNANGWGNTTSPVTILVGNSAANEGPQCVAAFSPATITQNQSSQLMLSCHPAPASIEWDAPEAGAPAASGWLPVMTFPGPGVFTYKLRVANPGGVWGPKIGATINVVSDGSCVPGPYVAEFPGNVGYSQDVGIYATQAVVFAFSVASGANMQFQMAQHSAYNVYGFPNSGEIAISKCRGDFNVPAVCKMPFTYYNSNFLTASNSPYAAPYYCKVDPGVTYFINARPTDCTNSPSGICGFRLYRSQ